MSESRSEALRRHYQGDGDKFYEVAIKEAVQVLGRKYRKKAEIFMAALVEIENRKPPAPVTLPDGRIMVYTGPLPPKAPIDQDLLQKAYDLIDHEHDVGETEMVERVARALSRVDEQNGAGPWEFYDSKIHDRYRESARAAIAAMREPTEAMMQAAFIAGTSYEAAWVAAIDEALR